MEQLYDIFILSQFLNGNDFSIVKTRIGRARHRFGVFVCQAKKGRKHPGRYFIIGHFPKLCKHIQRNNGKNLRHKKAAIS